jgi:phosphoribosylglycinamide formyltransferase 1
MHQPKPTNLTRAHAARFMPTTNCIARRAKIHLGFRGGEFFMAIRIAVLVSGSGTTLQNILGHIEGGTLDGKVCVVIASRANVFGLERARKNDIPAVTVSRKESASAADFQTGLWSAIREHKPDLVVLAGFMSLLDVPDDYVNRIMNVHPALIPSFCGKGMYGHHVHEAVLDFGAKVSGATVHFVDQEYDHGPIIMQGVVPVEEGDDADALAERVQAKERELYPQAIQSFAEGRIRVEGRIVHIQPKS